MKRREVVLLMVGLAFILSCEDEKTHQPEGFIFNVGATIAIDTHPSKFDYTLEIIAKDAPLGNVQWTKTIGMPKSKKINIPDTYGHYTFKASKPGYISHIQHFLGEELADGNLSFEFIPESLEGFIRKKSFDNVVTAYLPAYENRCKLYVRFDVAEGYLITYKKVNMYAASAANQQLGNYIFIEQSPYTISLGNTNINMYYNRPFSEAIDYCRGVDLTLAPIADEIDDVNLTTDSGLDYEHVDGNYAWRIDAYHHWKGSNNP